ncbi:MAG TPA: hypothetical protein DGG94_08510, partial [Micromonosporaceae bacterium]|nr:hypothetical protein [Micromonosporaceae bacterium]
LWPESCGCQGFAATPLRRRPSGIPGLFEGVWHCGLIPSPQQISVKGSTGETGEWRRTDLDSRSTMEPLEHRASVAPSACAPTAPNRGLVLRGDCRRLDAHRLHRHHLARRLRHGGLPLASRTTYRLRSWITWRRR